MNKRTVILSVSVLFVIFSANLVSADYIQVWVSGPRSFTGGDTVTWDLYNYQGKIKIYISWSGHASVDGYSTWNLYVYTDASYARIYQSADDAVYIGTTKLADAYANTIIIDTTTGTVEFYNGATLVANGTIAGSYIDKIVLECPTTDSNGDTYTDFDLNNLYVYKYSNLLTSLNIYDENTGATISSFDFSESNDTVRVSDVEGYYIARTYKASIGSALDAYLVKYTEGHWYSIQTEANATVEALRSFDGVKKVVAWAQADENGVTSMFLADGVIYTFRVTKADGTVEEYVKVTSPSNPTIYLSSTLSSVTYKASSLNYISYVFEPADRILYVNQTNNTVTAKVSSTVANIQNVTLAFYKNGILINSTNLTGSPTGGALTIGIGGNFTTMDYLKAVLTVYTTDNESLEISQMFIAKEPINSTLNLYRTALDVPGKLGIGQLGMVIILTFFSLALAAALGAGERGAVILISLVYVAATALGWINWIITLFTVMAGIGVLMRRGEA